jgi:DNA mismatch repair protein MutL
MSKIRPLPKSVIHAIAAGEVVERPAVVVKELIENSLDAGATMIKVWLENSGVSKIVVSDNGQGMDETDLELSFQHHTTSKIRQESDLEKISTFGFRGEALASIAHVSRLTIQSKTADQEFGQQIIIENQEVLEKSPVGTPTGTTITVENLFANLPARRKFLKNPNTEFRNCVNAVITASLSHPEVGFSLIHNQKNIINLPENQTLSNRATSILGAELSTGLLPISNEKDFFKLRGFLGSPQLARKNSQKQFLFVNHRPVTHSHLAKTIKESYGSLLDPRSEPLFVLFLDLPPALTDINIHPRKEMIKFMDEKQILELVQRAVEETLSQQDLTYQYQPSTPSYFKLKDRTASSLTSQDLKEEIEPWQFDLGPSLEGILQVHNTYLVAQTKEGLLIIDQHAAHERILYNQFLAGLEKVSQSKNNSVELPAPIVLNFSLSDAQVIQDQLETFSQIGFQIEPFGGNSFKVTHVPQLLKDRNPVQVLQELVDDLLAGKPVKGVDTAAQRTVAYLSCRSAVKAGDPLTQEQRKQLIEKLLQTENSFTCPHGRPTTVTFTINDLEKMFRRK